MKKLEIEIDGEMQDALTKLDDAGIAPQELVKAALKRCAGEKDPLLMRRVFFGDGWKYDREQ